MTVSMFILFIFLFFGSHYIVEKNKLPMWLTTMPVGKQLLLAVLLLLIAVVLGGLTKMTLLPIGVTILLSSMISSRFRKGFSQMEKGGKI